LVALVISERTCVMMTQHHPHSPNAYAIGYAWPNKSQMRVVTGKGAVNRSVPQFVSDRGFCGLLRCSGNTLHIVDGV
jgi:hypothetical protein